METRYSTFDRELLAAMFLQITDHSPSHSTRALIASHTDKLVNLDKFFNSLPLIEHIKGADNVVADTLSRVHTNALLLGKPPTLDFAAMAEAQATDP